MSDTNIGPSGATALANALQVNKTLQEINLGGTLLFGNNAVWFNGLGDWIDTRIGCNAKRNPRRTGSPDPWPLTLLSTRVWGQAASYPHW